MSRRSLLRAQEVCDLAQLQPYVLSSWEAEFPDLGMTKRGDGPRVYRPVDVELVLRIKQLVFGDGLTIAGAKRRLSEEGLVSAPAVSDGGALESADEDVEAAGDEEVLDAVTRRGIRSVRSGLEWILGVLGGGEVPPARRPRPPAAGRRLKRPSRSAKVKRTSGSRPRRTGARAGSARPAKRKPALGRSKK